MANLQIKVSYHHGTAEEGRLDLYDAGVSIQGLARALAISTHALINDGEIRKRASRATGAEIYISPSRRGSFQEIITIVLNADATSALGYSVAGAALWDLVKWTWSKAVDLDYEPETAKVRRLENRKEPFIGEIEEALEAPLERFHRPVKQNRDVVISVSRNRTHDRMLFNSETLDAVSLQYDNEIITNIIGNVTRYNILSGFGRMFVDELDKTVSFMLTDNVTAKQKEHLTWSMDQANRDLGGKISFDATKVLSAKGAIKRYVIEEIRRIDND